MNIDLVREANGDVYAICRETGERIQNVMISAYQIRQPHADINSANDYRYRIMDRPTMQITLETTSDIQITQRAESQPPSSPQYAGPTPTLGPYSIPQVDMHTGASIANVSGLERMNFGMDGEDSGDEPAIPTPRVSMSPPPSLFFDDEIIPSLNEHPASDEIAHTEEKFLVFDSTNEVTQELIRMFRAMDMNGVAGLLLRAPLYGRDFVSEAWSGFTSHLVSEISTESLNHTYLDFVNLMCMMTPEEAWKCFTLNADTKNWTEMQWDRLASRRIQEELSHSSSVCISSKSVDSIESLDVLV